MKLVRYGPVGKERPGLVDAGGHLRDLSQHVGDIEPASLAPDVLARLARIDENGLPLVQAGTRLGAPVGRIGKIVAIGLNYVDHAAEANFAVPSEPVVFMKATTSISGPNDDVLIPPGAQKVDWEVEMGAVIGQRASFVEEGAALGYVAGYCCINDVSERAYQLEREGTWDKGKGCDTFAPIGPWLVTADEVPNPQALDLWLDVNGQRMQSGNTRDMVFGVAQLVSYVSKFMTLEPGDVIATGTPPGVGLGRKPPVYLKAGDVMTLSIQGLGQQRTRLTPRGG